MECILRHWVVEEHHSKKCYAKNIIYSQHSKTLTCSFVSPSEYILLQFNDSIYKLYL